MSRTWKKWTRFRKNKGKRKNEIPEIRAMGKRDIQFMPKIRCPYCGRKPEWVSNAEIFGKAKGRSHMIYLCRPCNAYVGCHKNTRQPYGVMADRELRIMRMECHDRVDPLWKSGEWSRQAVYDLIKQRMHLTDKEAHFGMFTKSMCKRFLAMHWPTTTGMFNI